MSDEPEPAPEEIAAAKPKKPRKPQQATNGSFAPDYHRLLPCSGDAEQGVLCSFLLSPRDIGGMCVEAGCTSDWFHLPAHATIFSLLFTLWEESQPIDFITLTQRLRDRGQLDQCGGAAFITSLFTFLPTAANAGHYLEIVREKHYLREIIRRGTEHVSRAYEQQDEVADLMQSFEQAALSISTDKGHARIAPAKEAVMEAMEIIQRSYESEGEITGISTGFHDLDRVIDGVHPGDTIVIAARPSSGKTSLAMNIADHMAVELKKSVAVFSIEMPRGQLSQRMVCSRARVNLRRLKDGIRAERDFPALTAAASKLAGCKMFIDDSSDLTIQELRGRARRLKSQHQIEVIFVDYLQLLHSSSKRSRENRQQEVAEVSGGLKAMAKELGVGVIVLAQISREFDKRGPQARPRLSDLRESGAIEADADVVAFLVRPETSAETAEEREELAGVAELIVAKNRNGPNSDVQLTFFKEFTRFEDRALGPIEEEPGLL